MWKTLEDDLPVDICLLDGAPEQRLDREQACEAAQQFGHHGLTGQIAESGLELRPLTENIPISCRPLLTISCPEVLRLLDVYHDECGTLYPIVDIEAMRQLATLFYANTAAPQRPSSWRGVTVDRELQRPLQRLMVVLAIAGVLENLGTCDFSYALVDAVEAEIDHRPCGVTADLHLVEMLVLMSLYQFYRNKDILAWRSIGLAARVALELGWHLSEPPQGMAQSERALTHANTLFWCIYIFDRRCSFGTALPFAINDADIDPQLPEPQEDPPYLFRSLISHARLGCKIGKATSNSDYSPHASCKEQVAFFTYQVQDWQNSLSPELWDPDDTTLLQLQEGQFTPLQKRLRVFFRLQALQLRMMIHRPPLVTSDAIVTDVSGARVAVEHARESIHVIDRMQEDDNDLYSSHRVCFNYFLYAALTTIAVATEGVSHSFIDQCRDAVNIATELIGQHIAREDIAQRLWSTMKHVHVPAPRQLTGLPPYTVRQVRQDDLSAFLRASATAAAPMGSRPQQQP